MIFLSAFSDAFPSSIFIILGVCALLCAVGFYKFVYFLSVGYGFAISGAGIAMLIMYFDKLNIASIILCALLIIYGIRLSGFLLYRELKSSSYRKTLKTATNEEKKMPVFVKATIWVSVAILYVMQVSPVFYRFVNGSEETLLGLIGCGIMIIALIIESVADLQKSQAKKVNPKRFCDKGLYKIVRCPNYFGEILFWTGVLVSGVTSLNGYMQWIIAVLGYILIFYVMVSGAKRLEIRQNKNYGLDEEYKAYVKKTPILFPLIPIYHLENVKFIK